MEIIIQQKHKYFPRRCKIKIQFSNIFFKFYSISQIIIAQIIYRQPYIQGIEIIPHSQHFHILQSKYFYQGSMFGLGLGMDMGMMMGMEMGMGMGMGMGGMGMGMGRQEIIINNNGYGGGTTTIIEEGGFFGPREQIIINNGGGYGGFGGYGGYGNNAIIVGGNTGYGMCAPGCRNACCVRVCPVGCMNSCCRPPVMVAQPQVIQTYQPQVIQQQPQVRQQPVVQPQKIPQPVKQQPVVQNGGYYQQQQYPSFDDTPQQYAKQNNQSNNNNPYSNNNNNPYSNNNNNNNNNININPYLNNSNNNNNNVVNTYQPNQNTVPYQPIQKQVATQVNVNHSMLIFMYGKWQGPKSYQLNRVSFDKYAMSQIRKMKIRTNLIPHSNSLQYGQIIMKIVVGNHDIYFAAQPNFIEEYFNKILLIKLRWPNIPADIQFPGDISGPIMKKSDILGNWEQRFVRITKQDGLMSYRNQNQNYTLHIKSTRQIWTWFEIIQGKYVVIKLKNNNTKVQFGIPIAHCQVWISAFYSLLEHHGGY